MMSTDSRPMLFSFSAASLVLGDSSAKVSTTAIRYSRANWERIARIPARYIFLLTLCEKFSSGEFGNARPPPRQMGEEVIPERARPVPFWRHGFLVLCLTVSRPFRSEEHTSELQSLMRISYAVFCLKKKKKTQHYLKYSNRI